MRPRPMGLYDADASRWGKVTLRARREARDACKVVGFFGCATGEPIHHSTRRSVARSDPRRKPRSSSSSSASTATADRRARRPRSRRLAFASDGAEPVGQHDLDSLLLCLDGAAPGGAADVVDGCTSSATGDFRLFFSAPSTTTGGERGAGTSPFAAEEKTVKQTFRPATLRRRRHSFRRPHGHGRRTLQQPCARSTHHDASASRPDTAQCGRRMVGGGTSPPK